MSLRANLLYGLAAICFVVFTLPNTAAGDDPCEDPNMDVKKFTSSLPQLPSPNLHQGQFHVKGSDKRFTISYLMEGKVAFKRKLLTMNMYTTWLEVTPIMIKDHSSALFLNYAYGAGGRIQCSYVVFPSLQTNRFLSIQIGGVARVEDLDADREMEIVALEIPEEINEHCPIANSETPYWDRIFHLSLRTGKLIDVSDQFPQHYAFLTGEVRNHYKQASSMGKLPPECQRGFQQLIKKAERFARGKKR